jgi:DNA-binding transcriptional LysR family regulator
VKLAGSGSSCSTAAAPARLTLAGEELLKDGRHLLRAAVDIECRVQRVAKGWETELRIVYDDVIPSARLYPLISEFYAQGSGTRVRIGPEVLGGCWDALMAGRADLCIGAPAEPPLEAGYTTRPLGDIDWVFAGASHSLAQVCAGAGCGDHGPPRGAGGRRSRNLPAQPGNMPAPMLTVSTLQAKLEAQIAGLGWLRSARAAAKALAEGQLLALTVEEPKPKTRLYCAWRLRDAGKALKWWVAKLEEPGVRERLLA